MKRLFLAACGLLFLGACAAFAPDNNSDSATAGGTYNADGVFVAYCSGEPAPVMFTKNGFPIIDDQACIPEPEVLGIQITPKTKSCPDGKLLVGNVCLPHGVTPRTPTVPCDGAGDQNPFVEGVQCEAPTCEQQGLFDVGDGQCEACAVDLDTGTQGWQCEAPTCEQQGLFDVGDGQCEACAVDLDTGTQGWQCEAPTCEQQGLLSVYQSDICVASCSPNQVEIGGVCLPKNLCNSGGGNGSEGLPEECDPGNSGGNNQAGD